MTRTTPKVKPTTAQGAHSLLIFTSADQGPFAPSGSYASNCFGIHFVLSLGVHVLVFWPVLSTVFTFTDNV
jgi:hypothetical protein